MVSPLLSNLKTVTVVRSCNMVMLLKMLSFFIYGEAVDGCVETTVWMCPILAIMWL